MGLLGKLFGKKEEEKTYNPPEMYSEKEMEQVDEFIVKTFGAYDNVFHEIMSPDIHVDIFMINPTEERNYHTLVTCGMGAHKMNVPEELSEYALERAELLIRVPADWDINSNEEKDYWPVRWLKILARLPIEEDSWLGYGHTVPNGADAEPFAENTRLGCMMLISPTEQERTYMDFITEDGEEDVITFYEMLPLYPEEMNHKLEHNAEAVEELLDRNETFVLNINRKNFCQ